MAEPLIPRLYPIIDAGCFAGLSDATAAMARVAEDLIAGGARILQYRNKTGDTRRMLTDARELARVNGGRARMIMNDRADLCLAAEFDGVHVGQEDLSAEAARKVVGVMRWVGVSTHNPEQVREADGWPVDYIAVGPVFATSSKERPEPVIGVGGVRLARSLTRKPLVAIGGISRSNAQSVIEAGADAVAVISDVVANPRKSVEDFLRIFEKIR